MHYQFEKFRYDYLNGIILKCDKEIKLTNIQKKLLNFLLDNPKKIHSKQELMDQVWGRVITENSINQFISILRGHIEENPTKPKFIITHFGKGISFEGSLTAEEPQETKQAPKQGWFGFNKFKYIILAVLLLLSLVWLGNLVMKRPITSKSSLAENQKLLILPSLYDDSTTQIQRKGMESLLALNFNHLETEGQFIFDNTNHNTKQAIEKYWHIDQNIVVMSSQINKKGDNYELILELANQIGSVDKKVILAQSLSEALNNKIKYINNIQNNDFKDINTVTAYISPNEQFIEALGHQKSGDLQKAKQIIKQVLEKQGELYQARLVLAEILFKEKEFDQSLAQFSTLKSTNAYKVIGTEIELGLAKIKFGKGLYQEIVDDLNLYQSKHPTISEVKKSKIKLQIGDAYSAFGDIGNATKFYQDALLNINEQLNPTIYAQSYYGQGSVLLPGSNEPSVYILFEQSLSYAKLAGDIHQEILALNAMSKMSLLGYDWDKSIELQKQALGLMESIDDKNGVALGLGTLVATLNQSGYFSEAKVVNEKLGKLAIELQSDMSMMHYLHYGAVLSMNVFDWDYAQQQIDQHLELAIKTDTYDMQLHNAFIAFELLLAKKDAINFKSEWDKRTALIKLEGFERFQVYMDYYLARYYKMIEQNDEAVALFNEVIDELRKTNDIKLLVDATNQLAEIYLTTEPQITLDILSQIEPYDPHPNPYLEIKARAFNQLNNHVEALSLLNQAKLNYNESWTAEIQTLLESVEAKLEP